LFDVLILDVTAMCGNDLELTALSTVTEFVNHQHQRNHNNNKDDAKPRLRVVIIKSKALTSLARRLIHAQRLCDHHDGIATTSTLSSTDTRTIIPDLKWPRRDDRPYLVAAVGVGEYRQTIPYVVRPQDAMVEVGCFKGTTTKLLHQAAATAKEEGDIRLGYCIGVDIGPKIIARAQRELPNMYFAVGNAWKTLDLLRLKTKAYPPPNNNNNIKNNMDGYDVVYADIGSLSGPDGTLESLALLDALGNGLEPRCIVIKILCMTRRLASSLRAFVDVII
jgi:hypothetical protein